MKTELKKEDLAKLYRQFSRQKYNKYRHQFPRMRESQLVSKIIKEWESLTPIEKENLYKTYVSEKHISDDKSDSSENNKGPSPGSGGSKQKKNISRSSEIRNLSSSKLDKKTPVKKAGVKVFVKSSSSKKERDQDESSDFARDGAKKDFQISESSSKQIGEKVGGKKKKITKVDVSQPKTEYLKFFKFYYDKLSKEHRRWSSNQISTIIKLLWKRKQHTDKSTLKVINKVRRERRRISGRMAFRRNFNYSGIEVLERWRQLPLESKVYWRRKGEGLNSGERRVITSKVNFDKVSRKSSDSRIALAEKPLSFLSRSIVA